MRATNSIPLAFTLLPVGTVNCIKTRKAHTTNTNPTTRPPIAARLEAEHRLCAHRRSGHHPGLAAGHARCLVYSVDAISSCCSRMHFCVVWQGSGLVTEFMVALEDALLCCVAGFRVSDRVDGCTRGCTYLPRLLRSNRTPCDSIACFSGAHSPTLTTMYHVATLKVILVEGLQH
jgi:hypothetical protein